MYDLEGEELPDVAAARDAAEQSARETLIEAVKTGDAAPEYIQMTDGLGHEVATIFLDRLLRGWPAGRMQQPHLGKCGLRGIPHALRKG